ncbi:MAG TPA: helix-turn-helix transcriptional regulator [Bacteroidia bacterium]|jgi:transcriptional regulator with XRE-family HTH domain|nr:helix-turn-helix transcriptional regulator [Bacteroidia bacterium]
MNIQQLVGARIKSLRKTLDETQESMAFKAGIDKTYWNEVENGKRNISVRNLGKIIIALGINFTDFFEDESFSDGIPVKFKKKVEKKKKAKKAKKKS